MTKTVGKLFKRALFGLSVWVAFNAVGADNIFAQSIETVQNMTFGEGVIRDNSASYSIVIQPDGDFTTDNNIFLISDPEEGIYRLINAPPTSLITVSTRVDQNLNGAGEDFVFDDLTLDAPVATDINGEAVVRVGARMRTSGNNGIYTPETSYTGRFTLTIIF